MILARTEINDASVGGSKGAHAAKEARPHPKELLVFILFCAVAENQRQRLLESVSGWGMVEVPKEKKCR